MTPADLIAAALHFALNCVFASLTLDPGRDVEDLKSEREAAAAMLATLNPLDAVEAACAARAVTAHHASMACFRRAAMAGVPDAIMTRLIASGMALSRLSGQLIKALEQRGASARPRQATVESMGPGLADKAAASAGQRRTPPPGSGVGSQHPLPSERETRMLAAGGADGRQDPMPSERSLGSSGLTNLPLNRQERRRLAKQAARDARRKLPTEAAHQSHGGWAQPGGSPL